MNKDKRETLFRLGAEARLVALDAERAELLAVLRRKPKTATGKKPMSAAMRRAIGRRMKRMWAEKRKNEQKKSA